MRLFLSYRRKDSQPTARAMKEFLDGIPRVKEVFFDFDGIPPGSPDFVVAIKKAQKKSDASIILIGPEWAGPKPDGSTRILEPEDHVRREVASAIALKRKVFPVLVDGAPMPAEASLPDDLKSLSRINATTLRTAQFKDDMIDLLNDIAGKRGKGLDYWKRPPLTVAGIVLRIASGAVLAAALLFGAAAVSEALAQQRGSCGSFTCLVAHYVGGLSEAEINTMPGAKLNQQYNGLALIFQAGFVAFGAALPFLWRAVRR